VPGERRLEAAPTRSPGSRRTARPARHRVPASTTPGRPP
jgi:hypothetical protein